MLDRAFQAIVKLNFDFLVSERGYHLVETYPFCVRYENSGAIVQIGFDARLGHELNLFVGIEGSRGLRFSLGDLLRYRGAPEAEDFSFIQVYTNDELARWLSKLADALRSYAGDFLPGTEEAFAELDARRERDLRDRRLQN